MAITSLNMWSRTHGIEVGIPLSQKGGIGKVERLDFFGVKPDRALQGLGNHPAENRGVWIFCGHIIDTGKDENPGKGSFQVW